MLDRFWEKVSIPDDPNDCWEWTASVDTQGYGRIRVNGGGQAFMVAHRFAYEVVTGEQIDQGLTLDHLCRNTRCVNPLHLDPVTHRENVRRGKGPTAINAAKTHCINGHEFTPDNTGVSSTGNRSCRACNAQRGRDFHTRNKEAV